MNALAPPPAAGGPGNLKKTHIAPESPRRGRLVRLGVAANDDEPEGPVDPLRIAQAAGLLAWLAVAWAVRRHWHTALSAAAIAAFFGGLVLALAAGSRP